MGAGHLFEVDAGQVFDMVAVLLLARYVICTTV